MNKSIEQLEQEAKQAREDFESLSNALIQMSFALKENTLNLQNLSKVMIRASDQYLASSIEVFSHQISGDCSGQDLPEVSQEERDSDGWIVWNGGSCPVDENVKVELKFRSFQYENMIDYAGGFSWYPKDDGTDIVAYRIVKGE